MSEELGLEQRIGQSSAVHGHECVSAPPRPGVNLTRDDVLAHAAFAGDEDLGIRDGRALGERHDVFHAGIGDDERQGRLTRLVHSACSRHGFGSAAVANTLLRCGIGRRGRWL
jgi:hypothetical protein